ncbi:MAG: hypothetical protein H7257_03225 [Taibaiella sp.]|nr:hypothetical protein [Taibaiella sp.]
MHTAPASLVLVHSLLRYVVLLFTVIVALQSLMGMIGKKEFTGANRKMALFMMISCDVQLLIGLAVYITGGFMGMSKTGFPDVDHYNRFYGMEHPASMIVAIILIHLAYFTAKKSIDSVRKYKRMFWYSFIALMLFMAMIPWPGRLVVGKPLAVAATHR